jgi:hypothetical protein
MKSIGGAINGGHAPCTSAAARTTLYGVNHRTLYTKMKIDAMEGGERRVPASALFQAPQSTLDMTKCHLKVPADL